ncbi:MAG: DNA primase [bacterium]
MARRIPDETLQAIRDRVSLVEVVSAYVHLKRAGRNHLGLCPFHGEKTPSFTVSEERGLFHCFGCGESGTAFTFLMKMERLDFLDAVTQLAKRAGVALPERDGDDPAAQQRERLYAANVAAERFFRESLAGPAGAAARRYLAQRGLRDDTIARFALGFAPAGGTVLTTALERQKIAPEVALQAGLLGRSQDGRIYDRFRGRVTFPIRDRRGRTIAFGGRSLGDEQPKYLNSPETPLFKKGEGLYGVAEAREPIRASARAVLVEGYMDALVLAQEGIGYVMATLGTALTANQLRMLAPLGGDDLAVFFFFDGDRAGRNAAVRAFGVCAEAGVWGRAAFLPEGHDPDSFTRQHGAAATLALLDAAPSLIDFYFDAKVPAGGSVQDRSRVAEEVKALLPRIKDPVQRDRFAQQATLRLDLTSEVFFGAKRIPDLDHSHKYQARARENGQWPAAELQLIELMAYDAPVAELVDGRDTLTHFRALDLAEVGRRIITAWRDGRPVIEVLDGSPAALLRAINGAIVGGGPLASMEDRCGTAAGLMDRIEGDAARLRRQAMVSEVRRAESTGDDRWRLRLVDLNNVRRREGGAG